MIWQNDLVQLYNADCIDILPTLDIKPDLIIADPPYGNVIKDKWDNEWKDKAQYLNWSGQWIVPIIEKMPEHASFYIFGGIGERSDNIIHLKLLIDSFGLYFKDWITWKKARGMGNRRGWMYTREELLWYVKNNKQFIWNINAQYDLSKPSLRKDLGANGKPRKNTHKRYTDVWEDNTDQQRHISFKHYTPKPEPLIERIILAHTQENDLVLDPFLGSGTTCATAQRLGRRCIGIEKNIDYFAASIQRMSNV